MQTLQQPSSPQRQSNSSGLVHRQYLPINYGGLEPIQESEISSQETRGFSDRKPEFQFQAPSLQTSQRDRSESERSAGAYEALLGKISFLESELVKERASTNVLKKEKSVKRQETEEKKMLQEDLSVVSARIEELEDKLTNISTENQRLQSQISNQKSTINDLQGKNKLLSSAQVGAATRTNTTQILAEDNLRTREYISEQMRTFWKEHFERVQAVTIERYEAEKRQLIQELDLKQQLNQQLQSSFNNHANYLVEKTQMALQIESQLALIGNLEQQLQTEHQTSADCQEELKSREVEVTQVQICLNELEMKLMELKSVNEHQSEQLSRINEIESEAEKVLQENTRLQNELQECQEEKESSEKQGNKEKEQLKIEQNTQNKQWQARLNIEQEQLTRAREQWGFQEAALTKELDGLKVQGKEFKELISSLEEQVTILEDDKEKLLVILTGKADLEKESDVLNESNARLEAQVTQLLQSNSALNSNLNSRLKEIGMWKDRHQKSAEECRKVSQEYQEQISKLIEEHTRELQEEKTKNARSIERMGEQLHSVQQQLEQFQTHTSQQHSLELEQQRGKVSKLNQELSNCQDEVISLQQCLIELEQHHQRKASEQNEHYQRKLQDLLKQKDAKIIEIQRNRDQVNISLKQAELLNGELQQALLEQQKGHGQTIARILEERDEAIRQSWNCQVDNNTVFQKYPSELDPNQRQMFEVLQRQQELQGNAVQDKGFEEKQVLGQATEIKKRDFELFAEKQKDHRKSYGEKVNKPAQESRQKFDNGSQYQPLFQQTHPESEQQQFQRASGPLFPQNNPLEIFRSSLQRNKEDIMQPSSQDNDMSLQEKQLKRELEYLLNRDNSSKQLIETLSAENKQLQKAFRDLERKYYTKNDVLFENQENQEDTNGQEENSKGKQTKNNDGAKSKNTDSENINENQNIYEDSDHQDHGSYQAVSQKDKEEGEEEEENHSDQEQNEEIGRRNFNYNKYENEEEFQGEDYDPLNEQEEEGGEEQQFEEDGEEQQFEEDGENQQFEEDNPEDFDNDL